MFKPKKKKQRKIPVTCKRLPYRRQVFPGCFVSIIDEERLLQVFDPIRKTTQWFILTQDGYKEDGLVIQW